MVVADDGTTTVLRSNSNRFGFFQVVSGSGLLLDESGDKVWAPSAMGIGGPKLVDLETGETALEIPEADYPYIRAVDGDGRVYLARNYSGFVAGLRVMVFSPDAKEDRLPIEVDSSVSGSADTVIASDGSIWTVRLNDGLYRFDGDGWKQVERWRTFVRLLGTGTQGEVLVRSEELKLWRGEELIAQGGKDLKEFIRDHRAAIAEAFDARTLAPTSLQNAGTVIADASGNIWLQENDLLYVLVGDEWLEAKEFLKAAGSRTGTARLMAPLGNGSRLYVSDKRLLHDGGKSFFAEVKDGVPAFFDAPHTTLSYRDPQPLRDRRGDLWIYGNIARANGTSDAIFGQFVARLSTAGVAREIKNVGRVMHVDESDNVWLAERFPKSSNRLTIVRDNKISGWVDIPHVDAVHAVVSDRPGSVYALSTRGLEHLVAEGPEYREFRHAGTYLTPTAGQHMHFAGYSSLGYFLLVGGPMRVGVGNQLHLIRLPQEKKK